MSCSSSNMHEKDDAMNKADSLLNLMTLDEKIGQMTQICFSTITLDGTKNLELHPDSIRKAIVHYNVGSFLSGTGSARNWLDFISEMQQIALHETRLGIPLLIGVDHIHGANYIDEGTFFPHHLTISCSFDTSLVKQYARITAIETSSVGISWNFAPVLDVGINPYWPRYYETFGEDPMVCSMLGAAYIESYQNTCRDNSMKLTACGKHFIGYSDTKSGWDRTPAEIPWQKLYEFHVPPFENAIKAGVKTMMANSGEVNGQPVHSSRELLTGLLQNKLNFEGVLVTDIKDIQKIVEIHAGAQNEKEATLLSVNAGIDMSMACNSFDFIKYLKELVKEGKISEERINLSVKKILRLKYDLGLFENAYAEEQSLEMIGTSEHRKFARKVAEESVVLLKNEGILPMDPYRQKILLTGFAAHSKKMMNGAWTLEWEGAEEKRQPGNMPTLTEALEEKMADGHFHYIPVPEPGDEALIKSFNARAKSSDVILLTLGEKPYSEFKGNITNLKIDPQHEWLFNLAKSTGKPVIVLLIEGRPRLINDINRNCDALLFVGYPGISGARALANILFGEVNPSGKLSFTYPASANHCTPYYRKHSEKYTPLYPFGHGLSYTSYKYSNLKLSDSIIHGDKQNMAVSFNLTNTGEKPGKEVVLIYIQDEVGKITRPVRKLAFFRKVDLQPGETKELTFMIEPVKNLSYPDESGNKILEGGYFRIIVNDLERRFYLDY